jgi:hypothetical protein
MFATHIDELFLHFLTGPMQLSNAKSEFRAMW